MKKIIFLVALVLLVCAGVYFLPKEEKTTGNNNVQNQGQITSQQNSASSSEVLAATSTISQSDSFFNIQASYPQFTGVDQSFNSEIANLITSEVATFKQNAQDYQNARQATATSGETVSSTPETPFDFIAGWKAAQINDKYVSFVINIYYFAGGAHGINEVHAFNYDVTNKKEIAITDFLGQSDQSLQNLSELARKEVASQLQATGAQVNDIITQMTDEGTQPSADNFQEFNFTSGSLIIYFQQYQVAPGNFGPITITLPKNLLSQNGITSGYLK